MSYDQMFGFVMGMGVGLLASMAAWLLGASWGYDYARNGEQGKAALILKTIGEDELYGLDIVKREPKLSRGTIYVWLDRMESAGLIQSRQEDVTPDGMLPRRLYRKRKECAP